MERRTNTSVPVVVEATLALEAEARLDPAVGALAPVAEAVAGSPGRDAVLRGAWLGHALHPMMTDFPLGLWLSGSVLDLFGGRGARGPATRLIGLGVAMAAPTALTGLAEFRAMSGQRERRVGVVHAAMNSAALGMYAASYLARRRSRHTSGVALGIGGGMLATVGGYFGGHLTEVRKVSSHHPAFDAGPRP